MIDYVLLGNKIKYYREINNLTQQELSGLTGISRTHISNIEQGKKKITLESVDIICNALQMPVVNLFEEEKISDLGKIGDKIKDLSIDDQNIILLLIDMIVNYRK
jgi:transcriptional regulator with XRE-family HTH domain